jgi:glyoxylase-like metal-dependent hydrolase (beta-lactamase superfamily II)
MAGRARRAGASARPLVAGAVRAGGAEVFSVVDTVGLLGPYAELFPNAPAEAWRTWRQRHPELFDGESWRLRVLAFVVRAPRTTVLVDSGVGPAGQGEFMPMRQGRLIAELAQAGVEPGDVDVVFISHIHVDHVGWNHAFPRARILLHSSAWELAQERGDRDYIRSNLLELGDRVETIDGDTEVAAGVVAFPTPGHSTGHMSLRVGEELILLADAAPHPAQLEEAGYVFDYDDEPEVAVRTRRELLSTYGDRMLACPHFPGSGFGRLESGVWRPLA